MSESTPKPANEIIELALAVKDPCQLGHLRARAQNQRRHQQRG
ncbi:hypothetical protein [Altericroceibacterium endophyticum]|nr:hypothetical protein [Altericroceibacterium endophyticum]